jgi:putative nucleotidyltransferase with HDIG domain
MTRVYRAGTEIINLDGVITGAADEESTPLGKRFFGACSLSQYNRKLIFIVDPWIEHKKGLVAPLSPRYDIETFADETALFARSSKRLPSLILIDESTPPDGGEAAIRQLRLTPAFKSTPIIGMTRSKMSSFASTLHEAGLDCLVKSAPSQSLIEIVARCISRAIEDEWLTLEENQRLALRKTIVVFKELPEKILNGESIKYETIRESCHFLVAAVRNNEIDQILRNVKNHDNYSYVHSLRVAVLLAHFGNEIGLKQDELLTLSVGGLLHDIGKVAIPPDILNKPGQLSEEEWAVMRSHVDRSLELIQCIENRPRGVMTIAAQHHEKLDGTGYPNGLKGSDLNELARMAAIVDVFGALTDLRVYKPPFMPAEALDYMRNMGPDHLDQNLVKMFRSMLLDTASLLRAI